MAEGPGRARVETERKSGRRRKKVVSDEIRKELIETPSSEASSAVTDEPSLPECAVCLQTCIYPSRLPCTHIFCFLCLKGIASQSKRCAMCRQDIPQDYLEHPDLLQVPSTIDKLNAKDKDSIDNIEGGYQWFYEGRNGWWQYDARTNRELELAYKQGNRNCELLIAGFLYVADFNSMLQMRRNEPSRCRRIKRDLSSIPKKGIAGIRSLGTDTDTTNLIEQMNNLTISPAETELTDNNNDHNTIAVSNSSSSSVNTSDNQISDVGTSVSSSFGDNCN